MINGLPHFYPVFICSTVLHSTKRCVEKVCKNVSWRNTLFNGIFLIYYSILSKRVDLFWISNLVALFFMEFSKILGSVSEASKTHDSKEQSCTKNAGSFEIHTKNSQPLLSSFIFSLKQVKTLAILNSDLYCFQFISWGKEVMLLTAREFMNALLNNSSFSSHLV